MLPDLTVIKAGTGVLTEAQVLLTAANLGTPERAGFVTDTFNRLLAESRILPTNFFSPALRTAL